jgi:hypothetical protein
MPGCEQTLRDLGIVLKWSGLLWLCRDYSVRVLSKHNLDDLIESFIQRQTSWTAATPRRESALKPMFECTSGSNFVQSCFWSPKLDSAFLFTKHVSSSGRIKELSNCRMYPAALGGILSILICAWILKCDRQARLCTGSQFGSLSKLWTIWELP